MAAERANFHDDDGGSAGGGADANKRKKKKKKKKKKEEEEGGGEELAHALQRAAVPDALQADPTHGVAIRLAHAPPATQRTARKGRSK